MVLAESWCGKQRASTWIQVDLGRTVDLHGLIVQGRQGGNQWVAHFYLSYSDDGVTWTAIKNEDGTNKVMWFFTVLHLLSQLYRQRGQPRVTSLRRAYIIAIATKS